MLNILIKAVGGRAVRPSPSIEKAVLCLVLPLVSMALAACQTCVGVKVTLDRVPIEGAYVELLDEEGVRMREGWTDEDGEYCFGKLPLSRTLTVKSAFDSRSVEAMFNSGGMPDSCGRGLCPIVELSFPCQPPDDLEPNDTLYSASPVELPYTNPLAALCPQGDTDFYRLDIDAQDTNVIATVGDAGTGASMYKGVGLFDANGYLLASDWGSDMRIVSPVPDAGTYYLAVTHGYDYNFAGDHDEYGTYAIDIRVAPSSCVELNVREDGGALQGARVRRTDDPFDYCYTDVSGSCCLPAYQGVESSYEIYHPEAPDSLVVAVTPEDPGSCDEGNCAVRTVDFDYTCVAGIVSRGGEPAANIRVDSPYGYAITDQSGTYCVRSPKNQVVYVQAGDSDLCSWDGQNVETLSDGSCLEGGCTELDFELPGLSCVSVAVTRDGVPVEGAWVHPSLGCSPSSPTGPDGTFCFAAPASSELMITVWDPLFHEYRDVQVETGEGGSCGEGGCSEVEVQLVGRTCVSGTVRWHDGEPADDIRVNGPAGEVRTGPDGGYCLEAPQDRDLSIGFDDPVYGFRRYWDVHTGTGGSCDEGGCTLLDPVFPPTSCVSGLVSREGGEPPIGATLCLNWGEMCVEPDEDGGYCIRAPVDGDVSLVLRDPVTGDSEDRYLATGPEGTCQEGNCLEADFELPPIACVSGVVLREGEPEEGARVCLGYGEDFCVMSGPVGEYCLPSLADSTVQVRVKDPVLGEENYGYAETAPSGSCDAADCAPLDFELRGATCISGIVREGTVALQGAEVSNDFGTVYTNEEGRYCLPALSNTSNWIRATHPTDSSYIWRYRVTNSGGRCEQGGCTTQNFTFD